MKYAIHALSAAIAVCVSASALASSHREAPSITKTPKVDATDFYMFNSYEEGRSDYVTIIANYLPLQDAYGGPNYFALDPDALYEIHIDNNGDAVEDLTFQFDFNQILSTKTVSVNGVNVAVPLVNIGPASNPANVQVSEEFDLTLVKGDRRSGMRSNLGTFDKPLDNIGEKSFPDYPGYASGFIQTFNLPGCANPGKVFVGQRQDAFAVNLGETFDLINYANPTGPRSGETNDLADKNVTSLALEIPKSCLMADASSPVIGAWTTASLRQARLINPAPATGIQTSAKQGGAWTQVSRLGMPLVNEVVIGLPDKDKFNASEPKDDGQFATYVTNPTLPVLINALFNVPAPNNYPRLDLVGAFLTGLPGVNQLSTVTASEMLRLNTSIAATAPALQMDLGALVGDNAGFPNGRRPIDDVVDIELRVAEGILCATDFGPGFSCSADNINVPAASNITDGVQVDPTVITNVFPYLGSPIPGSKLTPSDL